MAVLFVNMVFDEASNLGTFEYIIESSTGEYILDDIVNEVKDEFDILALPELEYGYLLDEDENYRALV